MRAKVLMLAAEYGRHESCLTKYREGGLRGRVERMPVEEVLSALLRVGRQVRI